MSCLHIKLILWGGHLRWQTPAQICLCETRLRMSYSMLPQRRHSFLFLNHKCLAWSQCLYESLLFDSYRHEHMREQVPVKLKVRGGFQKCRRKCREAPVLQTADYLYMAWGPLESWGSPLWGAHREYVTSDLTMTSGHFVLRSSEGKKLDLFGDHRGFDACCVFRRCSALPLLCPCAYYRFH